MKRKSLTEMTVNELVDRFAEIGVAQYNALDDDDNAKFRKLYKQIDAVDHEIRARGREARLALTRLYTYPNMQVRLAAAKRTLGVAPGPARQTIQAIADSKWPPQYLDAGMTLWNLDNGTFVPD